MVENEQAGGAWGWVPLRRQRPGPELGKLPRPPGKKERKRVLPGPRGLESGRRM